MSVGWRRQAETDTLCDFALMVKYFAEQAPNSQKLKALAMTSKLRAEMALQRERVELRDGDILGDRSTDCKYCRSRSSCRKENRDCNSAKEKAQIIRRNYGEQGLNFIRWAAARAKEVDKNAEDNS